MKFMKFFSIFLLLFELCEGSSVIMRKANVLNSSSTPPTKVQRVTPLAIDKWDSAKVDDIIEYMLPAFSNPIDNSLKDFLHFFMYGVNSKPVDSKKINIKPVKSKKHHKFGDDESEDEGSDYESEESKREIPHIALARVCKVDKDRNVLKEYKIPKIFCSGNQIEDGASTRRTVESKIKPFFDKEYFNNLDMNIFYTVLSARFQTENSLNFSHSERAIGGYLFRECLNLKKILDLEKDTEANKFVIVQIRTSLPMCEFCQFFWNGESFTYREHSADIYTMCHGRPCFVTKENKKLKQEKFALLNEIKSKINCHDIKVHVSRNMHKYPYNNDTGVSSVVIFKGDANV